MTTHQILHYAFYGYGAILFLSTIVSVITGKVVKDANENERDFDKTSSGLFTIKNTEQAQNKISEISGMIKSGNLFTRLFTHSRLIWYAIGVFSALKIYFIILLVSLFVTATMGIFYSSKMRQLTIGNTLIIIICMGTILYKAFSPLLIR